MREISCDVAVIGSGGAGLMAAVSAAEAGLSTLIVDKGLLGKSGATVGAAAMAATGPWSEPGDGPTVHYQDVLAGGQYMNNRKLAHILALEAGPRVTELAAWGLMLDHRSSSHYFVEYASGHSYRRALARSDRIGVSICKVLRRKVAQLGAKIIEDGFVTRLLTADNQVGGLVLIDGQAGQLVAISAKAVVLATGGLGQLYPSTTNPLQATGDGLALALRAGCIMVDMEQVQFYPAGLVYPESLRSSGLGLMEYSKMYNAQGERFMHRYQPDKLERTTRDVLSQSIFAEIRAGRGTEHGGVYLDVTAVPEEVFSNFRHEYELCLERGLDLRRSRAEIAPTAHYFMGGVQIDEWGTTNVRGLYAAGEVAGGVHGANRLNGNSLADILVFGRRAGRQAARWAREKKSAQIDHQENKAEERHLDSILTRDSSDKRPPQLRAKLQQLMWEKVGVMRDEASLSQALADLVELEADMKGVRPSSRGLECNRDLLSYLELENMRLVAKAIAHSALIRQESRGAHFREDYPNKDDQHWLQNVLTSLVEGQIVNSTRPIITEDNRGAPNRGQ